MGKRHTASPVIIVMVTCPTEAVARRMASRLIEARLAACVNLVPRIESTFRWKGQTEHCREALLLVKTTVTAFGRLKRAILTLHPYEVPEVIALPLAAGHRPYLSWVQGAVA